VSRPGGEADKFGNLFEGAWTIYHLLLILAGRVDAITIEDVGERGTGSEFTLAMRDQDEAHQVKLQDGTANGWTPRRLNAEHIWQAAKLHVEQGRKFRFVSTIPAPKVKALASFARRSESLQSFLVDWLNEELKPEFTYLSGKEVYGSGQVAWQALRGIYTESIGEDSLRRMNDALAAAYLEGAPPTAAALSLGDLAQQNLGVRLDAPAIEERLGAYELRRAQTAGNSAATQGIATALASWKGSVERMLLQPSIPREESTHLADMLRSGAHQVTVVVGAAGAGKSAVLYQGVRELEAEQWPVLGLRLDRLTDLTSTSQLGVQLDLNRSPVAALAAAAGSKPCLLVIDQLDAVSLASGRMPQGFDTVADLMQEAAAFPQMRVLLACRAFDVNNDDRIRRLLTEDRVARIDVHQLADQQVTAAVQAMRLPAELLTAEQRSLLTSPFNLVLLSAIADQSDALSFASANGLLAAYWDRKRRNCRERRQSTRFGAVIEALANAMSERQELSARISVLDAADLADDAEVLASEHVLVRDGQRYAFFHESFFDYAFARIWVEQDQPLVEFLLGDEQELFRRAQVRQILLYIRGDDPGRFIREAEAVLAHSEIRFHIKAAVLAVIRSLADPSTGDWQMMERLVAQAPDESAARHLWAALRSVSWFDRLDAEGVAVSMLASGGETAYERMMDIIPTVAKQRADRLAELIAPHAETVEQYPNWLAWVTRFADVHESRSLFELILDAVRQGDYNGREGALWLAVYGLGQHQPAWAVELLAVWLVERPGAFDVDDAGRLPVLRATEHNLLALVPPASERASAAYVELLVPYLLRVMALTETETTRRPITDGHFSYRQQGPGPMHELDDALLHGTATALRELSTQDRSAVQPMLEKLAQDPHDTAQWLLYEALRAASEHYADWAADLLLQGDHRFHSGYLSDPFWTTRELLQATTPYMSHEHFAKIETAVAKFRPSGESRKNFGFSSFKLLSSMAEDRLSDEGKRRLGELRRKFGVEQPVAPSGVMGGGIGSPIPAAAVKHMNDDQWLRAMAKYRTDQTNFETLTGGAFELAQAFRAEATNDPSRFVNLALQLADDTPSVYTNAILEALGQTEQTVAPALVFDVIRHIAAISRSEDDQALSIALRRQLDQDVPDDIIGIILDRALHAVDPTEDMWSQPAANGQPHYNADIFINAINTARGQAVITLGDLIVHDVDGHRTKLLVPSFSQLAEDPSVAVRSCVAHLLAVSLRHASDEAITAFGLLIATDDRLLATRQVGDLIIYIGIGKPDLIDPVIQRMLASEYEEVREAGGLLAAYAGLELGLGHLLTTVLESDDAAMRKGAANLCARNLPQTTDAAAATAALLQFIDDAHADVRKTAAQVAAALRNRELQPFAGLLTALIESSSFGDALSQLLITLAAAPDRIDDIVLHCARRYIDVYADEAGNIATSAAGEAQKISQLTLRAYAQASDPAVRRQILDLIDGLLLINAVGVLEAVDLAER
jgi:hypothetical protein